MDGTTFSLTKGSETDVDQIYHIHTSSIREVCSSHYGAKEIELWSGKQAKETYIPFLKNGEIIVAKGGDTLVGFVHYIQHNIEKNDRDSKGSQWMEIKALYVDPRFIRRGVGKLLVEKVESLAKEKGAESLRVSSTLNAVPFYSKFGFCEVNRKPHRITLQVSVECVCMIKDLETRMNKKLDRKL